jgi:hypothetical protein
MAPAKSGLSSISFSSLTIRLPGKMQLSCAETVRQMPPFSDSVNPFPSS